MSYIDELRERFLAAEQRFGQINEAGREYRDRLMGLMSRIEEEIRCRRDVEQQQAKEIERLSGEVDRISGENEQLRTMMMSLLTAVEAGDTDYLGSTLNDMDTKVVALIGEGQGAVMAAPSADSTAEMPADMAGETPDFSAELADDFSDEADEGEAFSPPSFPAGDMMSLPEDEAEADHGDDAGSEEMVAEEMAAADETPEADEGPEAEGVEAEEPEADAPKAEEEDISVTADDALAAEAETEIEAEVPSESLDAGEPMQASAASDMAAFYGSDDDSGADAVPSYSHAVAGWEDFLDDEETSPEASAPADGAQSTLSEVSGDHVAEDAGDPEAGSIHDLIDRVKTVVDDDDDAGGETANLDAADEAGEDDDDGGKAAAQ